EPAGRVALRPRIEVGAFAVELACVGIGGRRNLGDSGDPGVGAARMIEENIVADAHVIEHEVARLVVADTEPSCGLAWGWGEIVYAELVRLGFHQPEGHDRSSDSEYARKLKTKTQA